MPTMASTIELSVVEALTKAYLRILELRESGKQPTGETNEFGQQTFKADIEAGRAVFDSLRESGVPVVITSEEHGREVRIVDNPRFLGVIDELDGSKPYTEGTGRYATMLGIFGNLNPKYADYLVSGIVDHVNRKIYLASSGKGAYILDVNAPHHRDPIHCLTTTELDPETTQISVDGWFKEDVMFGNKLIEKAFRNIYIGTPEKGGAANAYYTDLAAGRIDAVIEVTYKRNLEKAVAYGLITEAGGVMLDIEGNSLGDKRYLEFEQNSQDRFPVISAATSQLALALINFLKI